MPVLAFTILRLRGGAGRSQTCASQSVPSAWHLFQGARKPRWLLAFTNPRLQGAAGRSHVQACKAKWMPLWQLSSRGERQPLAACVHCARVQTRICWRLPLTDLHLTPFTPPYAARGKPLQSFKGYRQCAGGNLSKRSRQSSHSLLEQPPEPLSCHGC